MRPHLVILGAECIQPALIFRIGFALADGLLQGPMHPLDFALRLGMTKSAVAQPDSQTHDPYRQFGQTPRTGWVPPGRAMVHQHGLRQSVALKGFFQAAFHSRKLRTAQMPQQHQIAAMIVSHRQRAHAAAAIEALWTFEVHLPQLIRLAAFKSADRFWAPVLWRDQCVTF